MTVEQVRKNSSNSQYVSLAAIMIVPVWNNSLDKIAGHILKFEVAVDVTWNLHHRHTPSCDALLIFRKSSLGARPWIGFGTGVSGSLFRRRVSAVRAPTHPSPIVHNLGQHLSLAVKYNLFDATLLPIAR